MRRRAWAGVLAAALAAGAALPRPALAYRRTCPNGTCIAWNATSVEWRLNAGRASALPSCDTAAVTAAAQAAFAAWQAADAACGGPLRLVYGGTTSSADTSASSGAEHLVVFREGWCSENAAAKADPCFPDGTCSSKYGCFDDGGSLDRGTLAVTGVKYVGKCIVDADMEIADWSGNGSGTALADVPHGWYWSCVDPSSSVATCVDYGDSSCVYQDLRNTITHEAGHFVGLAHPCGDPGMPACTSQNAVTTMYPAAAIREISKRTLSADDAAGVCAIYPAGFVPPDACSTAGGCGCGGGPAGAIAALLGLAAFAPRWRRASRRGTPPGPAPAAGRRHGDETITPA